MNGATLNEVLPLLAPLVLVQVAMMIAALLDLRRRTTTRGPRWVWGLVIVFVSLLGPTLYFLFGREEA